MFRRNTAKDIFNIQVCFQGWEMIVLVGEKKCYNIYNKVWAFVSNGHSL
jgi:hypothetical protein